ncbi:MAG: dienelactone hydrolase family protein [Burkholderiaceae bacterium]|nr:dienelactone hydrolase family protein [Burkholderiaceae bacterium]MCD8564453.1 dienelactone hydrolase family protein [Burkholderiaceae bacterium]
MANKKNLPTYTPDDGLKTYWAEIATGDVDVPAYVAMPDNTGRFPVVLVVQEIFGVHEHIQDICRRFAREGYLAIAPELYLRQGKPADHADIESLVAGIVSQVPDEQVMADLDACLVWAGQHGGDLMRVFATGYCWGGRITWLYAAHQPMLRAAVAWYGRLTRGHGPLQVTHPIDVVDKIDAPVLGLYGALDAGIPVKDVQAMQAALKKGSDKAKGSEILLYEGADHGFFADYRPMYNAKAAKDAWQRCLTWMSSNGPGT